MIRTTCQLSLAALLVTSTWMSTTTPAIAQPSYSIDFQSPASQFVNSGAVLTNSGTGQFPNPNVTISEGLTGLGFSVLPAPNNLLELDALSFGNDLMLTPTSQVRWEFSVDEHALGIPSVPGPSVTTESVLNGGEAAADIYASFTLSGPLAPPPASGPYGVNIGIWDGNGNLTPFNAPGLNLREPNPANNTVPDVGDNVDAWEADSPAGFPTYFSLDSAFVDVLETPNPPNAGSAAARNFVGGDVLVTPVAGGTPVVYAAATQLGLDAGLVTDVDDLDALVLWENGVPGYQPTTGPYSWLGIGGTDMLLYSVRRGSAVIGTLDAISNVMIAPGDILVPFLTTNGNIVPGIMIPAELLGLRTSRSFPGVIGDDMDALDVRAIPEPGSATLLLVAGILLVTRRSRRNVRR